MPVPVDVLMRRIRAIKRTSNDEHGADYAHGWNSALEAAAELVALGEFEQADRAGEQAPAGSGLHRAMGDRSPMGGVRCLVSYLDANADGESARETRRFDAVPRRGDIVARWVGVNGEAWRVVAVTWYEDGSAWVECCREGDR